VRLLQPWHCDITVVRNRAEPMEGVDDVLEADRFADALPGADLVVLALALTPETQGMFSADEFGLMEESRVDRQRGARSATSSPTTSSRRFAAV
jgi:phosphoglycerate dehydrogenase-like enzyme